MAEADARVGREVARSKKLPPDEDGRILTSKAMLEEIDMGHAHEVAQIRRTLRDMLMSDRYDGASEVLARFFRLALEGREVASPELVKEAERWKARLAILTRVSAF